jgi:murein DD-endopeptidase MepM/ murein hydrolase activator NlpD
MPIIDNLVDILKLEKYKLAPIFQPDLTMENTFFFDLSTENDRIKTIDFDNVEQFSNYIQTMLEVNNKTYGYGGYMEDREVYRRSPLFFLQGETARSVHLGIDVWVEAETPVYSPLDAMVHSFQNNDHYGDYGPTIILEHQLEDLVFFTLYGHLSMASLENLKENKQIKKGDIVGYIGNSSENGEWPPHLHFQIITDMMDKKGDYNGVVAKYELERYKEICPNPLPFFKLLRKENQQSDR